MTLFMYKILKELLYVENLIKSSLLQIFVDAKISLLLHKYDGKKNFLWKKLSMKTIKMLRFNRY